MKAERGEKRRNSDVDGSDQLVGSSSSAGQIRLTGIVVEPKSTLVRVPLQTTRS